MNGARELTSDIMLCTAHGRLNPDAVGWSRTPRVTANLCGRGRAKRWDYWGIQSPEAFVGITVSDLDYATLLALHAYRPGTEVVTNEAVLPFKRLDLSQRCDESTILVEGGGLYISITTAAAQTDAPTVTTLTVRSHDIEADVVVRRPRNRESLSVVVPWSPTRFQYTVKDVGIPATGHVKVNGTTTQFPAIGTFATRDFGRGKWPYRITWNWGVGVGSVDGSDIALQLGGKWTDGTGSTENGVLVDGRLTKIAPDLIWEYDATDWLRPWRVRDAADQLIDVQFHPDRLRQARTEFGVIGSRAAQAFGTWTGWVRVSGDRQPVVGLRGWAEELRNRW